MNAQAVPIAAERAPRRLPISPVRPVRPIGPAGRLHLVDPGQRPEADATDPVVIADRYRIEARLRRGHRATWYRVRHLRLGEPAVLCLLHAAESHNRYLHDGLWREAERAKRVDSLHVLPLSDIGRTSDDRLFFVRPLPEAPSLAVRMRQSTLPVERAAPLLAQIAGALAAIHGAGLVHQALDPEHIFVADGPGGLFAWLWLVGPASQLERDPRAGSPYEAPEQRQRCVLGTAANIYSLAAIARDLLAGPTPRGEADGPAAVELLAPALRRALDPVPERRPRSAQALVAELLRRPPPRKPRSVVPPERRC